MTLFEQFGLPYLGIYSSEAFSTALLELASKHGMLDESGVSGLDFLEALYSKLDGLRSYRTCKASIDIGSYSRYHTAEEYKAFYRDITDLVIIDNRMYQVYRDGDMLYRKESIATT